MVYGLWRGAQFALLPPLCLLCGQRGTGTRDLCAACAAELPRNKLCCPRCALPLQTPAPMCGECLKREPPFSAATVPFVYGHPLDMLMTRLKFGRSLAAGRVLSQAWIDALREIPPASLPQVLIPVPLHNTRLRERGYNQALELARPLAREFGIALSHNALMRIRSTPAQSNLDAQTRRRNLRGAFALAEAADLPPHVAVIDDVMTTGSTLRECSRTLRRAGVARVDVWALARAPRVR
ncbi:MAG TPA: ComF family protein [Rudaea sp.]|nr:ComF family protein [Rudaea sp.]